MDAWGSPLAQFVLASAAFLLAARMLYLFYGRPSACEPAGPCSYVPWPGAHMHSPAPTPTPGDAHTPGRPGPLLPAMSVTSPRGGALPSPLPSPGASAGGGTDGGAREREREQQREPPSADDIVVVDATHPSLPTLSHHKGANNPAGLRLADTSTGIVLNALTHKSWNRALLGVLRRRCVTTNHFDVDAFLSCWAFINRKAALQHEGVLRHMARIGDFREALLSPDLITAHGSEDRITFIREAATALKLVCWINSLERRLFSAPYESQGDCDAKMAWFLPRFGAVLQEPESAWSDWQAEYTRVMSGFDLLAGADCMVETPPGLSLAVLSAPEPLHYVSLFSHTIGCDTVLMMYDDQRYELEAKYTQFVAVVSRPVTPRLDFSPLAAVLNQLEARYTAAAANGSSPQQHAQARGLWRGGGGGAGAGGTGGGHLTPGQDGATPHDRLRWVANSLTDTGPLLRLQPPSELLTKAQRYGHPYERPIHSSSIPPHKMQAIVQSFLSFGLQGLAPQAGGFEWRELQELNGQIHWQDWASCVLQQASRGELDAAAGAANTPCSVALSPVTPRRPRVSLAGDASQQQQQIELTTPGRGFVSPVNLSVAGQPLPPAEACETPTLSQPSIVAHPAALAALAAVLPPLHRGNPWLLIYSTGRDGISLATLMRKAEKVAPTLLLVRDSAGGVFGAYVTDAWRYSPRFYGSGESFVFQLEPRRLMWPWVNAPGLRNDFYQHVSHDEGLGVGGAGHWAICLDESLLCGSSGPCDTYGSPCLASNEEFEIMAVELWHVH